MILLVLVCIATAALLAWLSVELWRITLRGDGVGRSVQAAELDETVERVVRERLYGDGHGSRRRVDAA